MLTAPVWGLGCDYVIAVRLELLCYDLRQEPETATILVLGTTTVRLDWHLIAIGW